MMSGTHKYSISGAAAAVIIFKESWPTLSLTPFYICYKIVHKFKRKKKKPSMPSISFQFPNSVLVFISMVIPKY